MALPDKLPGFLATGNSEEPPVSLKNSGYSDSTRPNALHHNWLFAKISEWLQYFKRWAVAEYDAAETYPLNAHVNSGGVIYVSLEADNIGNTPASNPTKWRPVSALASQAEAEEGTDNTKVMTPLRVAQHFDAAFGRLEVVCYRAGSAIVFATGRSFSVSAQEATPRGLAFSGDGTKAYVVGNTNDTVYQYTLATPWDLSTASYSGLSKSVAAQDATPAGIAFNEDGSKIYVVGSTNARVYEYTLSTPWDISTASYGSVNLNVSAKDTIPRGLTFSADGSKLYVSGSISGKVYQYTLSTPWDLSTASYSTESPALDGAYGVVLSADGTLAHVVNAGDVIYEYVLSTPWDISTASFLGSVTLGGALSGTLTSLAWRDDGARLYVVEQNGKKVHEVNTSIAIKA